MRSTVKTGIFQSTKPLRLSAAIATALTLGACGGSGGDGTTSQIALDDASAVSTNVSIQVELPPRLTNLGENLIVQGTVSGQQSIMAGNSGTYTGDYELPFNLEHTVNISVRTESDVLLGTAQRQILVTSNALPVYIPEDQIDLSIDSDGDNFTNIEELEAGSDPYGRNGDFDNDGTPDTIDNDDDNDGVADDVDAFPYNSNESVDTDNDGIGNNRDPDDDNDGVDDNLDRFPRDSSESVDTDGDGIGNNADTDDDNDGISDSADVNPLDAGSAFDTDGDGIGDAIDNDDDNDGVFDDNDRFPLDDSESLDTDSDGIGNNADTDDDNDNVHDLADPQPLNANITGLEDADMDGVPDNEDAFPLDRSESLDQDGDGIGNNSDPDDDGNGIPDRQENALVVIPRTNTAPVLDGIYGWSEWSDSVHCDNRGNYTNTNHLILDTVGDESEDNRYGWSWRAMHDNQYLYILVKVRNEPFYERFTDSTDPWQDDSVEIFIDVGNEGAQSYDSNDFQKVYSFNGTSTGGSSSSSAMRTTYSTSANPDTNAFDPTAIDESFYEIRIDMNSIGLGLSTKFGLDVHINDDDDGGDRDTKWAWYAPSGNDSSWFNPSLFGEAILAPGAGTD